MFTRKEISENILDARRFLNASKEPLIITSLNKCLINAIDGENLPENYNDFTFNSFVIKLAQKHSANLVVSTDHLGIPQEKVLAALNFVKGELEFCYQLSLFSAVFTTKERSRKGWFIDFQNDEIKQVRAINADLDKPGFGSFELLTKGRKTSQFVFVGVSDLDEQAAIAFNNFRNSFDCFYVPVEFLRFV